MSDERRAQQQPDADQQAESQDSLLEKVGQTRARHHRPRFKRGRSVGGYVIERREGEGGFGDVYQARSKEYDSVAAIKVAFVIATDSSLSGLPAHEARLTGKLRHPNIVRVYHSDEYQPAADDLVGGDARFAGARVHYIAMEWLQGKPLARASAPMEPARAVRIALQVARALDYAHELGVVHRDISPNNIYLATAFDDPAAQAGQRELVKVLDFGLGFIRRPASQAGTSTASILVNQPLGSQFQRLGAGTPSYMAPEQHRAEEQRWFTDIWGLGAVLYQLLGGTPLFTGEVTNHDPVPPLPAAGLPGAPPLPDDLRRLVGRMLDKAPRQRPRAAEVCQALEQVQGELARSPLELHLAAMERSLDAATEDALARLEQGLARDGDADQIRRFVDLLSETPLLARWLGLSGDCDAVWHTLYGLGRDDLDRQTALRLEALHRFVADNHLVLRIKGVDISSLLGSWQAAAGLSPEAQGVTYHQQRESPTHWPPKGQACEQPQHAFCLPSLGYSHHSGSLFIAGSGWLYRLQGPNFACKDSFNFASDTGGVLHSPDGRRYLAGSGGSFYVRDSATHAPICRLEDSPALADMLHWSEDGERVYAKHDYLLYAWDARAGALLCRNELRELYLGAQAVVGRNLVSMIRISPEGDAHLNQLAIINTDTLTITDYLPAVDSKYAEDVLIPIPGRKGALRICGTEIYWYSNQRRTLSLMGQLSFELRRVSYPRKTFSRPWALSRDNGILFCASDRGLLVALDTDTGAEIGRVGVQRDLLGPLCLADSDQRIVYATDETVYSIPTRAVLQGSGNKVKPDVLCQGLDPRSIPNWTPSVDGALAGRDKGNLLLVRDHQTLAVNAAAHGDEVTHFCSHRDPDGDQLWVTVDQSLTIRLWHADGAIKSDALRRCDALFSACDAPFHRVTAICFDGQRIYVFGKPSNDDQATYMLALGYKAGRLMKPQFCATYGIDTFRHLYHLAPLEQGLVFLSRKKDSLYWWADPLSDFNDRPRARPAVAPLDHKVSGGFVSFLPMLARHGLYLWDAGLWQISALTLGSDGAVTSRVVAEDVHVTNWHLAGDYLCVGSNFQGTVSLIHRRSGAILPLTSANDIAYATAFGDNAAGVETYSVMEARLPRLFQRVVGVRQEDNR